MFLYIFFCKFLSFFAANNLIAGHSGQNFDQSERAPHLAYLLHFCRRPRDQKKRTISGYTTLRVLEVVAEEEAPFRWRRRAGDASGVGMWYGLAFKSTQPLTVLRKCFSSLIFTTFAAGSLKIDEMQENGVACAEVCCQLINSCSKLWHHWNAL